MPDELELNNDNGITAPGLDAELDAALSSAFKSQSGNLPPPAPAANVQPPKVDPPKEIPNPKKEVEPAPKKEEAVKKNETAKKEKAVEKAPATIESISDDTGDKVPADQAAWNALRGKNKAARAMLEEREEKIKKLETALAEKGQHTSKEVEQLKEKIEELSKYRSKTDLETDPEFISKFDAPITERVESMKAKLKEWAISDDVISKIDFTNKQTLGALAKAIRANEASIGSEFDVEEFMTNAKEIIDLNKKRNLALDEHGKNYKQILEEKKKQAFAQNAENEGRAFNALKQIASSKDKDGNVIFPFLNRLTAKDGATPAETADIESHNKFVGSIYANIEEELKSNDPERKAKLAVAAAASIYLQSQVKVLRQKLQATEEELKKVAASGNETERRKVPSGNAPRNGNRESNLDVDAALDAHFSR